MGVIHFAPVGTRPGAVTSALSYLKYNQDKFRGFGNIIESVVIFTSHEVREGKEIECFYNEYGSQRCLGKSWKNITVLNAIRRFVEKELAEIMPTKGSVWVCVVDHNDYDDCFEKIAKALLKLSPGPKVGKHIWANLTGGTNILNAALLEVALLSGRIARLYYTFLSDIKKYGDYLQPPSTDKTIFDWREIPFVKTDFDEFYYKVLEILNEIGDWCEDTECLNRLKGSIEHFAKMDIQTFRQIYLNHMDGREIERENNKNRLSPYGKRIVTHIKTLWVKTLIYPAESELEKVSSFLKEFTFEELWHKL